MSKEMFVLALAVGAGLLAMWVHVRFPGLAPARMVKTLFQTPGSCIRAADADPRAWLARRRPDSPLVFMFVLPALVYALLCTLWVLKHASDSTGVSR